MKAIQIILLCLLISNSLLPRQQLSEEQQIQKIDACFEGLKYLEAHPKIADALLKSFIGKKPRLKKHPQSWLSDLIYSDVPTAAEILPVQDESCAEALLELYNDFTPNVDQQIRWGKLAVFIEAHYHQCHHLLDFIASIPQNKQRLQQSNLGGAILRQHQAEIENRIKISKLNRETLNKKAKVS